MSEPTSVIGNSAVVHSLVVCGSFVRLLGVTGYNNRATDVFIQVHATATVPADGAVPLFSFRAFGDLSFVWEPPAGVDLQGCCIVASTTLATKTITTGAGATDKVTIQAIIRG